MKSRIGLVAVLIVAVSLFEVRPTTSQDNNDDERIGDLETRVAELEDAVFGTEEVGSLPSTPVAGAQATLGGNAMHLLPPGEKDRVTVISVGTLESNEIDVPIVVRNNTAEPVAGIVVKGEVRDTQGKLLAVADTDGGHQLKPYLVNPGEVAVGFVQFGQLDVPVDATFTYSTTFEKAPGAMSDFNIDLVFIEAVWLSDRIVGTVRNPISLAVGGTYMNIVCLSPDGILVDSDPATIQQDIEANGNGVAQLPHGLAP
jgi:hypothetical protein